MQSCSRSRTGAFRATPGGSRLGLWVGVALAGALLLGPAAAEEVDDETLERLLELHHSEQHKVRMVLVPTVVTRKSGRMVRGLAEGDFTLLEDTVEQNIRFFSAEATEKISIAFLLDLSGSMRQVGKLEEAKHAIRTFVEALRPDDQFGLIGFADDQVTWITEFTSNRATFLRRLQVQEAYGQTALFDAVAAAPGLVDSRIVGRKAIILITDGFDNASEMNTFEAMRIARRVDVPIYSIGFSSLSRGQLAPGSTARPLRVLDLISNETGGALFTVHNPRDLKEAIVDIDGEVRFHYLIGYYPQQRSWDGSFRRIRLETHKDGLLVRARRGYYADP